MPLVEHNNTALAAESRAHHGVGESGSRFSGWEASAAGRYKVCFTNRGGARGSINEPQFAASLNRTRQRLAQVVQPVIRQIQRTTAAA